MPMMSPNCHFLGWIHAGLGIPSPARSGIREDLGRCFSPTSSQAITTDLISAACLGARETMPTQLKLNPRSFELLACHFEIMALPRLVYSPNSLSVRFLLCIESNPWCVEYYESGFEVLMHHLKLLLIVLWV